MSDNETKRACTTCLLCLRDTYGYSNYTPEETTLHCLADLNPALNGQEEPWSEPTPELAAALDVALTCPRYRFGAPATLDVEREDIPFDGPVTIEQIKKSYTDDDEAAALLLKYLGRAPSPESGT